MRRPWLQCRSESRPSRSISCRKLELGMLQRRFQMTSLYFSLFTWISLRALSRVIVCFD
uniref:Uncharacterized protein n=1 Tax=Daphnia magna TaxID=35525 RepID=A0A0P5VTZ0_9CRUS